MKRNVLSEGYLHKVIMGSISKVLNEDVLGDNWHELSDDDDDIFNNYEPFDYQDDFGNEHDWGVQGEEEFDPTEYDPDAYIDKNLLGDYSPSDGDLSGGIW